MVINFKEFIAAVAKATGHSKRVVEEIYRAALLQRTQFLAEGHEIRIVGYENFKVVESPASEGINPRTREKIRIPAKKRVKSKVGKAVIDAVNGDE